MTPQPHIFSTNNQPRTSMYTPKAIFTVLAGLCFVAYLIWGKPPLLPVGGICLCIANFVP